MNCRRIWAVFLRYYYLFAKPDNLSDLFFWPAVDIFLWGMTSEWFQKTEGGSHPPLALAILTGLVFWQVVWRSTYEISVNLLQEFWNRNLVNLFATPLKISEWVVGLLLAGLGKVVLSILFGALLVWALYALNIFHLGWAFLPYAASLTISGWFIGLLAASLIIYYGQRVQALAWMMAYLFAPFAAIFYPLSILPFWARCIGEGLPMTYVFEGMRDILFHHTFSPRTLLMSFLLNALFLVVSIALFLFLFDRSRAKGLARLE